MITKPHYFRLNYRCSYLKFRSAANIIVVIPSNEFFTHLLVLQLEHVVIYIFSMTKNHKS